MRLLFIEQPQEQRPADPFGVAEASDRRVDPLWQLRVQDADDKDFRLNLEMSSSVTLNKLDEYLRAMWLGFGGRLSKFTLDRWSGAKGGKSWIALASLEPGQSFLPGGVSLRGAGRRHPETCRK